MKNEIENSKQFSVEVRGISLSSLSVICDKNDQDSDFLVNDKTEIRNCDTKNFSLLFTRRVRSVKNGGTTISVSYLLEASFSISNDCAYFSDSNAARKAVEKNEKNMLIDFGVIDYAASTISTLYMLAFGKPLLTNVNPTVKL